MSRSGVAATPVVLFVFVAALVWAPSALAHARLVGTTPETDSTVQRQPTEVIFKYDEPIGGTDGAVRVYDSDGDELTSTPLSANDRLAVESVKITLSIRRTTTELSGSPGTRRPAATSRAVSLANPKSDSARVGP